MRPLVLLLLLSSTALAGDCVKDAIGLGWELTDVTGLCDGPGLAPDPATCRRWIDYNAERDGDSHSNVPGFHWFTCAAPGRDNPKRFRAWVAQHGYTTCERDGCTLEVRRLFAQPWHLICNCAPAGIED